MSDEIVPATRPLAGEVLPAERNEDPSSVVLTNADAAALRDWLQDSGVRYWEIPPLWALYQALREWYLTEAPW